MKVQMTFCGWVKCAENEMWCNKPLLSWQSYDVKLSHLLQSHLLVKYFSLLFILLKAFVLVGM